MCRISYCLRGERDLDRERVLERDRLPLLLFLPIFTSFLTLQTQTLLDNCQEEAALTLKLNNFKIKNVMTLKKSIKENEDSYH